MDSIWQTEINKAGFTARPQMTSISPPRREECPKPASAKKMFQDIKQQGHLDFTCKERQASNMIQRYKSKVIVRNLPPKSYVDVRAKNMKNTSQISDILKFNYVSGQNAGNRTAMASLNNSLMNTR